MSGFPNVLGVLVAEHLINNLDSERCAPVIKAVVRDLKQYMHLKQRSCGQRTLPIGFGGGSYKYDRKVLDYLAAGDRDSCVDFWTVRSCLTELWILLTARQCTGFQLAGKSDADMKGRDELVGCASRVEVNAAYIVQPLTFARQIERYRGIDIPLFLSEYGAGDTTKAPRSFTETPTLYSPQMTEIFSGGCAYEFWQGPNTYGLALLERKVVNHERLDTIEAGRVAEKRECDLGTVLLFDDFMNYKAKLAALPQMPTSVDDRSEQKAVKAPSPKSWAFDIEGTVPESCVDWLSIDGK